MVNGIPPHNSEEERLLENIMRLYRNCSARSEGEGDLVDDTSRIWSTASVGMFGRNFDRKWYVSRRAWWQTLTEALLPRMHRKVGLNDIDSYLDKSYIYCCDFYSVIINSEIGY